MVFGLVTILVALWASIVCNTYTKRKEKRKAIKATFTKQMAIIDQSGDVLSLFNRMHFGLGIVTEATEIPYRGDIREATAFDWLKKSGSWRQLPRSGS